ncbi:MAG: hypothetical protein GY838_15145 [bacterium]|nr:hypothetical protein [bacterium]
MVAVFTSPPGLGNNWFLGTWTLADYDQDRAADEEILAEFANAFAGDRHLVMLNETTVSFELPETAHVRLSIYDVRGVPVAHGVYFYELTAAGER